MRKIIGTTVGASMLTPKSFVLEDENGNSFVGVTVGEEVVFDVKPSDVKINKTFAGENGVQVGENTITYRTTQGFRAIRPGHAYVVSLSDYDQYNYTKLQCIIAKYNSDPTKRKAAEKIVIDDAVYTVNSSDILANVTKDDANKEINLNITNDTSDRYLIYYFTYKEEE